MNYSAPAEGFRIAYDRMGSRKPVVLLHGWPGDRTDYNALAPILAQHADVIVPALRGFGQSDKHLVEPETVYSAPGQAKGVIALMDELGLKSAVLGGYDVGSLTAQTVASMRPDLVSALGFRRLYRAQGAVPWTSRRRRNSGTQASTSKRWPKNYSTGSPKRSAPISGIFGRTGPGRSTSWTSND